MPTTSTETTIPEKKILENLFAFFLKLQFEKNFKKAHFKFKPIDKKLNKEI